MIRTKGIRDYRLEYAALTIISLEGGMRFGYLVGRNEPEGPKYTPVPKPTIHHNT